MPTHPIIRHHVVSRLVEERIAAAARRRRVRRLRREPPTIDTPTPSFRIVGPRAAHLRLVTTPSRPPVVSAHHDVA